MISTEEFFAKYPPDDVAKIAFATGLPLRLVADGVGEVDLAVDRYPKY